jgi:glycosyltransferase involved in cell wall biosynthesis
MDAKALAQARPLFANSGNVAGRLKRYNGVAAEALYHPPPLEKSLRPGPAGDYLYFPSRISGLKRQDLVLKALALTKTPVRMVFSGAADSARDGARFRQAIEEHGLSGRVEWRGHVTAAEMIELYAHALGVVFPPFDEDLGYVTLEAMLSEKPVVTTTDSGGPLEFVVDGESGFVTAPQPAALARALDRLAGDRELAARMGKAGRRRYDALSISWANVLDRLVTQQ